MVWTIVSPLGSQLRCEWVAYPSAGERVSCLVTWISPEVCCALDSRLRSKGRLVWGIPRGRGGRRDVAPSILTLHLALQLIEQLELENRYVGRLGRHRCRQLLDPFCLPRPQEVAWTGPLTARAASVPKPSCRPSCW